MAKRRNIAVVVKGLSGLSPGAAKRLQGKIRAAIESEILSDVRGQSQQDDSYQLGIKVKDPKPPLPPGGPGPR